MDPQNNNTPAPTATTNVQDPLTAIPESYQGYLNEQKDITPKAVERPKIPLAEIPGTYGDDQQKNSTRPSLVLPAPKTDHEAVMKDIATKVASVFKEVSQPDFLSLSNTIADLHSDKILALTSTSPGIDEQLLPQGQKELLDQPKMKELDVQGKKETAAVIQPWSEMLGKTVDNGTIIKVDDHFKEQMPVIYSKLKEANPTWTGEYVAMQYSKNGAFLPYAYNMAAAMKKIPSVFLSDIPDVSVYGGSKISQSDISKWNDNAVKLAGGFIDFSKMTPQQIDKYYSKSEMSIQDKVSFVLKDNPELSKVLMRNPDLFKSFQEELLKTGDIHSQFDQAKLFGNALIKAFGMDKKISPVAEDLISNVHSFDNASAVYSKLQADLSSKMKVAGQAALRNAGFGPKMDAYMALQTRMLTSPSSITDNDRKAYASMTLQLNDAISKAGSQELSQDWVNYQNNASQFKQMVQSFPVLLQGANSKEGQEGLDLMQKQRKGTYLANNIDRYFPSLAKYESAQAIADAKGKDKLSVLKTLYSGILSGISTTVKGAAQLYGGDKGVFEASSWLPEDNNPSLVTPVRPTNTDNALSNIVNDISNFSDHAANGIGTMALPIVLAPVGGEAAELAPFALQSYYETQKNLRSQGVSEEDANMIGLANMGLTALTMKFAFLPSRVMRSQIEKADLSEIMDAVAGKKNVGEAITAYMQKFIPTTGDAKNAAMAASQQVAMNIAGYYEGKYTGTKSPNIFSGITQMAGITYLLGTMGRFADKSAAAQIIRKYAVENPLSFATALDNAKQEALATGRFNLADLHNMENDVWKTYTKLSGIPKNFTPDQKIAAVHILDNIQTLKAQKGEEAFNDIIDAKIEEAKKQLSTISTGDDAAINYNNKIVEPILDHLKKIFPPIPDAKFQGIIARHGETDANRTGRPNDPNQPLNETGMTQGATLGSHLKENGVTTVITSSMPRAIQTGEQTGLPATQNSDLNEWNTGQTDDGRTSFDMKYYVNHPDEKPNTTGETFNEFLGRVQKIRKEAAEMGKDVAIIAHNNVMKLWDALDKSGGKWDEKAKAEFLKDSNDFNNTEIYQRGKRMMPVVKEVKQDLKPKEEPKVEPRGEGDKENVRQKKVNDLIDNVGAFKQNEQYGQEIIPEEAKPATESGTDVNQNESGSGKTAAGIDKEDLIKTAEDKALEAKKEKLKADIDAESKKVGDNPIFEKRKKLVDKYGDDIDGIIKQLKDEGRLEVKCPPEAKRKFSLRNLFKRA